MNLEHFIARRIVSSSTNTGFTKPIIRIAIVSIVLGMAVMILSVAIVTGFKKDIRDKVVGFGAHIQITNFDANTSFETTPVNKYQDFYVNPMPVKGIKHIQVFGLKAGIIKTDEDLLGVVLKGVGSDFDWSFFKNKIKEGSNFMVSDTAKTNKVLISRYIANKLKLKLADKFEMHFIQDPPRMRKFEVCGIYETGFEELDKMFVLGDIGHVQKLNNWDSSQVSGFEITLQNFDDIDNVGQQIYNYVDASLEVKSIKRLYPQVFDWLNLQDLNVLIIIVLMLVVAIINMASTLLIIILDRSNMIGILKALGSKNWSIRKMFLYNTAYIIGRGLLWGNLIGISLALLQLKLGIIKLSQESYYMSEVPIYLNWWHILWLNVGTLLVCTIMMLLPSYVISRISPVKSIRFN